MGADLQVHNRGPAVAQGELVRPGPVVVPVGVDETRSDHMASSVDGLLALDLVLGDRGIRPFLMPTLATPSYIVSGSMTRPLRMTRS